MTVCSWCDEVISKPADAARGAAPAQSHGICRSCLADELAKVRPSVRPAPLFSLSPALG